MSPNLHYSTLNRDYFYVRQLATLSGSVILSLFPESPCIYLHFPTVGKSSIAIFVASYQIRAAVLVRLKYAIRIRNGRKRLRWCLL